MQYDYSNHGAFLSIVVCKSTALYARSEAPTVVVTKSSIFWNTTPALAVRCPGTTSSLLASLQEKYLVSFGWSKMTWD